MTKPQTKSAFDIADFEDELSYDFGQYGASGVTPEPTTQQVMNYQRKIAAIVRPALEAQAAAEGGKETHKVTPEDVRAAFSDENQQQSTQAFEDLLRATAEVCSNKPSKSELNKLPHRMKLHFIGYIAGKFLGEASTPAMKR